MLACASISDKNKAKSRKRPKCGSTIKANFYIFPNVSFRRHVPFLNRCKKQGGIPKGYDKKSFMSTYPTNYGEGPYKYLICSMISFSSYEVNLLIKTHI